MDTASPIAASAGLALLSAAAWGGGDFAGGMGVKATGGSTQGALRVVAAAHAVSLIVLLAVLEARHITWGWSAPLAWGLVAGVAAGLSLSAFYLALARGAMGAAAAVSGLLAAGIPALVAIRLEGPPGPLRIVGFVVAAVAIWMIAAGPAPAGDAKAQSLWLPIGAGVGFGLYFVALRFANPLGVMQPMALARMGSLVTCLVLLVFVRGEGATPGIWIARKAWVWALGVAVLDTAGNMLFLAATRAGRLDVAAVLASLYPASTILLAAAVLKERPGRQQMVGMVAAVVAVVLITV